MRIHTDTLNAGDPAVASLKAGLVMLSTGEEQTLRRERVFYGEHRTWWILPRYGTGPDDRWTLIASPIPGGDNPASAYEDGQYANLAEAGVARKIAETLDNGESEED